MFNIVLALSVFSIIFILLCLGVIAGRRYGRSRFAYDDHKKLVVVDVAEAAVFGLLGLLIAFTFSGASERFENRKVFIIEEANAVDTAYLRLDMLASDAQPALRESFRQYLDSRLLAYTKIPDYHAVAVEYKKSVQLQKQIWKQILTACAVTNDQAVTQLIVPAINNMFDIANKRFAAILIHPPIIIFGMLIGLAVLGSFLAGYSTSKVRPRNLIHLFIYLFISSFILYVIIDLELPRMGLIRVNSFDQILINVRQSMDATP